MDNNIVSFATQLTAILGFIVILFSVCWRVVSLKDATIESLKEHVSFLEAQLDAEKAASPLELAERLSKRVKLLEDELDRLGSDQDQNSELLTEKERELAGALGELEEFKNKLEQAKDILAEFSCPYCGAMLSEMEYAPDTAICDGREIDFEHEFISYECGLVINDGKEVSLCSNRS